MGGFSALPVPFLKREEKTRHTIQACRVMLNEVISYY